jgi:NAD dependent epimerase/dehydratase family enzyme
MRIAVTGSNGMIGCALVEALRSRGDEVLRVVRDEPYGRDCVGWNPAKGFIDAAGLEGLDAVVHLAGENVAAGRWSREVKRRILESRTQGTSLLAATLSHLERRPKVLISASAVGYYGNPGSAVVTRTHFRETAFFPKSA